MVAKEGVASPVRVARKGRGQGFNLDSLTLQEPCL